ncbi:MAG TPA: hypothetical protein VF772_24420, partial [Terriglobales bacterium]
SHVPDPPSHQLHQQFVIDGVKGNYDTLPIISTSPRESLLSALDIRSKADRSTFSGRCIAKVSSFSF